MKKFTPILILVLIVGVVSISGCITILDPEDNTTSTNTVSGNPQNQDTNINVVTINNVNKTGNIIVGKQEDSNKIKNNNDKKQSKSNSPKISKDEMEKEIVRIMKLSEPELNFTANATLIYSDDTPYYIVDVFDDYGWFGYFEVNAITGPKGNDKDGYSFDGGAVRGETGTEKSPKDGILPELSEKDARDTMDKILEKDYSIKGASYTINSFIENNTPFYNISIEKYDENSSTTESIGSAIMDANNGEIISLSVDNQNSSNNNTLSKEKVYSVDEAGAYVDIIYKGKHVSVRENYPYYSPQNDKIYYSQEEEAEDLIKDNRD